MSATSLPVPAAGPAPVSADGGPGLLQTIAPEWRDRFSNFAAQPAIRRALPALVALGVVAFVAALYLFLAQGPQRILYGSLTDAERAKVVETLERGGIDYAIDSATGALSVSEDEIYRARMLVASDAGIAAPEGASEMLDAIPLGSSRTLEGERLRLARERELMLTIREIDGIEAVRVHLATPERSVFVRENNPPSASVMLRLVGGRTLSQRQVEAIVNLVAGSVPGMASDAVRVVDQNGRLLSAARDEQLDGLVLQREFESKLQGQVAGLLHPLLGEGNFSSQVQVELDQSEVTAARESYEREGALRSESERSSTRVASTVGGIPGVTANTPPPDPELVDGAPEPLPAEQAPSDIERATTRNYELGREVAVTSQRPGGLVKLSVAVAVSQSALAAAAPLTQEQLQSLVSAAVGANTERGDQVEIAVGAFEASELAAPPFHETAWFAQALRYGMPVLIVLLVLLFVVRPLMKRLTAIDAPTALPAASGTGERDEVALAVQNLKAVAAEPMLTDFPEKIDVARQFATRQPDRAVEALQRMLAPPADTAGSGKAVTS